MKATVTFTCTATIEIPDVHDRQGLREAVDRFHESGWPELLRNETIDLLHVDDIEVDVNGETVRHIT